MIWVDYKQAPNEEAPWRVRNLAFDILHRYAINNENDRSISDDDLHNYIRNNLPGEEFVVCEREPSFNFRSGRYE